MTTLVRWTPFRELDLMERQIRSLLGDTALAPPPIPAADVYETAEEFVVELEVPGFEEKDLSLEIIDHTVVVKGEVTAAKEEKDKAYLLHERLERIFERRFQLPVDADTDKVEAAFAKGVLELHAPRIVEAEPRKIAIAPKK